MPCRNRVRTSDLGIITHDRAADFRLMSGKTYEVNLTFPGGYMTARRYPSFPVIPREGVLP